MRALEMLCAADRILPLNCFVRQLETPVGFLSLCQTLRLFSLAEPQCGPIIERRAPGLHRQFALQLQLAAGLPAGIDAPGCLKLLQRLLVARHAIRLARFLLPIQTEPPQIVTDAVSKGLA